jgi:hypothetical protein
VARKFSEFLYGWVKPNNLKYLGRVQLRGSNDIFKGKLKKINKMEKEFLEWFEPNEKKFNHGHFDEKEVAYSAWLEGKKRSSQTQDAGKKLIPEGWYVYEAGQNPLNMLWFVVIMNFNDLSKKVEIFDKDSKYDKH